jgi:CTP synthase
MEILELKDHPYYVATQFHPEFLSRPMSPSPVFNGFILASAGKLDRWLEKRPTKQEVFSPAGRTESQEEQMKHVGFRPSRPSWMIPDSPPPSPSKSAPSSPAKGGANGDSPTGKSGGAGSMAL